jgi:hypothetical protein
MLGLAPESRQLPANEVVTLVPNLTCIGVSVPSGPMIITGNGTGGRAGPDNKEPVIPGDLAAAAEGPDGVPAAGRA